MNVNRQLRVWVFLLITQILSIFWQCRLLGCWLCWGLISCCLGTRGTFTRAHWGWRLLPWKYFLNIIECTGSVLSAMIVVRSCITVTRCWICGTNLPLRLTSWSPSRLLATSRRRRLHSTAIRIWISWFQQGDHLLGSSKLGVHFVLVLIVNWDLLFHLRHDWVCLLITVCLRRAYFTSYTVSLSTTLIIVIFNMRKLIIFFSLLIHFLFDL